MEGGSGGGGDFALRRRSARGRLTRLQREGGNISTGFGVTNSGDMGALFTWVFDVLNIAATSLFDHDSDCFALSDESVVALSDYKGLHEMNAAIFKQFPAGVVAF
jgi:hypothetical protein